MSLASVNRTDILKDRAMMLKSCRAFFEEREVLEVDVPILSSGASVDVHIELVQATCCNQLAYLHSSPEFGMKQLLALGANDIYQISHVFRDFERGERHTPEFMMIEWYRLGFSFEQMIKETLELISLFLDPLFSKDYEHYSYKQAFMRYAKRFPENVDERDEIWAFEIEPHLGKNRITVIAGFPPEQAALSRISEQGEAERFEVYFQGVELANGYHELIDPQEQLRRMRVANQERENLGKKTLPIDWDFIHALEQGLPDCCGVAVGFDRLMMLRHQVKEIRDVSCFFIR